MSFGEIPGGDVRAYYKLENVNDSGPNGYNLTNNNSVTFAAGKFTNGADFGSSGTNKGLTYGANPFSVIKPSYATVQLWFKLNSTANSGTKNIFAINTESSVGNGIQFSSDYSISSGTLTLNARLAAIGAAGAAVATITATADTNFHYLIVQVNTSSKLVTITLDRTNGALNTTIGTLASGTASPTVYLSIGNNRGLTAQVFMIIDEVIIDESFYANIPSNLNNRVKYYTQAKGRFAI